MKDIPRVWRPVKSTTTQITLGNASENWNSDLVALWAKMGRKKYSWPYYSIISSHSFPKPGMFSCTKVNWGPSVSSVSWKKFWINQENKTPMKEQKQKGLAGWVNQDLRVVNWVSILLTDLISIWVCVFNWVQEDKHVGTLRVVGTDFEICVLFSLQY